MIGLLLTALSYSFVRYALVVGALVALSAGLLGVPLVLKRYSFIGDGLSHVAFGAVAVAALLGVAAPLWIVLPVTALSAVFLLLIGENARLKGDSAIALLSVSALAVGYLLLHFSDSKGNVSGDVCASLFGSTSLLTLSRTDVLLSLVVTLVVLVTFALFYHKLFSVTFDETFARATGTRTRLYRVLLAVLAAVVIATAMELVGSLLVSALIVFPALSAMRLFRTYRAVTVASGMIAVLGASFGMLLSILLETPTGATIVVVDLGMYFLSAVLGRIVRRIG